MALSARFRSAVGLKFGFKFSQLRLSKCCVNAPLLRIIETIKYDITQFKSVLTIILRRNTSVLSCGMHDDGLWLNPVPMSSENLKFMKVTCSAMLSLRTLMGYWCLRQAPRSCRSSEILNVYRSLMNGGLMYTQTRVNIIGLGLREKVPLNQCIFFRYLYIE